MIDDVVITEQTLYMKCITFITQIKIKKKKKFHNKF